MNSVNKTLLAATCSIGALCSAAPAMAQDDSIVVTATRRASNIQDVPIAVTAVTTADIERAGVLDVRGLDRLSASFTSSSSQQASTTVFRIRGVGTTGNNSGFESSVGVFLDGVYLSRPAQALGDLLDLEQIEVLRGPQGTLFGRNTSAGALSITTRKPNTSELEAFANASYGNFGFANFQGGLNIPLIKDSLGLRVSGSTQHREGYVESVTEGGDSNERDRFSIRGQLLWEPTDAVSVRIIGDYAESDENCCAPVILGETPLVVPGLVPGLTVSAYDFVGVGQTGGVFASGPAALEDRMTNTGPIPNPIEQWGISGEIIWDLEFAELTYIPAYRDYSGFSTQDPDFTALDVISVGQALDIETMTHELRLQGSALGDRVDWLIGGFYSDEEIAQSSRFDLGADFLPYVGALFIANPMGGTGLGTNPLLVATNGVDAAGNFADNLYTQESQSWSIFTHNIISVTDRLELTLGARYVDEKKDGAFARPDASPVPTNACFNTITNPLFMTPTFAPLQQAAIGLICFPYVTPADLPGSGAGGMLPTPATFAETFEDEELVYTAKLGYDVSDNINAYFGFTHGFKSGGINLDATAAVLGADPRFSSEKVDAFELGIKSTLLGGRARANLAVFHMDITDFQVLEFTGLNFSTFNVPSAKSTGAELELQGDITENLSLMTSLTYADARYPDDCADGLDPGTSPGIALQVSTLCGARLTNSPEFTGVFGATYEKQISDTGWSMFAMGNARLETERRTSTQPVNPETGAPLAFDIQEGNTKYDARLGFVAPNERFAIEFWGLNLTDERTRSITFNVPFRGLGDIAARGAFIQEPRTYGVTVRAKF